MIRLKDGGQCEALTELGAAAAAGKNGNPGDSRRLRTSGGVEVREEASAHTFGYLREDGRWQSGMWPASSRSGQ
jgi:hypothetical protein